MISSGSRVHRYLTLALLLAFTMRALVPAGFMPSTERPFTLEICPQGFQIPLADKHADHASHHGHGSGHHPDGVPADDTSELFKHCPFSSAPGAAPLAQAPVAALAIEAALVPRPEHHVPPTGTELARSQHARAPPALLKTEA